MKTLFRIGKIGIKALVVLISMALFSCSNMVKDMQKMEKSYTYDVEVLKPSKGSVTVSKTTGIEPGTVIYLSVEPEVNSESRYTLETLQVSYGTDGTLEGVRTVEVNNNSFIMPAATVYVYAYFKKGGEEYPVSVNSGIEHGVIQVSTSNEESASSLTAGAGTTVSLEVSPDEGYEIENLTVTTASGTVLPLYENTFAMPAEAVTVGATFTSCGRTYSYAVVADYGNGNQEVVEEKESIAPGTTVSLSYVPATGYGIYSAFTGVDSLGRELVISSRNQFKMPAANVQVTVPVRPFHTITLTKPENGNLSVVDPRAETRTDELSDGAQITTGAFAGETIELSATATEGAHYLFNGYTVTGLAEFDGSTAKNSFTMPENDVSITVDFKADVLHAISIQSEGNGTVVSDVPSAYIGDLVTLTVKPDEGDADNPDYMITSLLLTYRLGGVEYRQFLWAENGISVFKMPYLEEDGSVTVLAGFAEKTYAITVEDFENGKVVPSKVSGLRYKEKITLVVTPSEGYKLSSLTVKNSSDASVSYSGAYTLTIPKSDLSVSAVFEAGEAHTITIEEVAGGSVSASVLSATKGTSVILTPSPDEGMKLDSFSVTTGPLEGNILIMPDEDVTITPLFVTSDSHTAYIISKSGNETWPGLRPGEIVTCKKAPAGYGFESVVVTRTTNGSPSTDVEDFIPLISITDTSYSFVMPDEDVAVEYTLEAATKDRPDTVGDIVLRNGRAIAYENRKNISNFQKVNAIAVIFYDGKSSKAFSIENKLLGIGLKEGDNRWATNDAYWYTNTALYANPVKGFKPITYVGYSPEKVNVFSSKGVQQITFIGTYDGMICGEHNADKLGYYSTLSSDAFKIKFPAFWYCKYYANAHYLLAGTEYENGWYLPTLAELTVLFQTYRKVNDSLGVVGGALIRESDEDWYWTSNQIIPSDQKVWLAAPNYGRVRILCYYKKDYNYFRPIRRF